MARYTDAVCRLCRRAGVKLFLKGERCYTPRCAVDKRRKPPGTQTLRRRRTSDWGVQLREKQKARQIYGVMEKQFRKYFAEAQRRPGMTGLHLLQLLEERLDNVAYRLNFADSRSQARQIVRHGHIMVNGRKVDIPSYRVKVDDVVGWKESSRETGIYALMTEDIPRRPLPTWLSLDVEHMAGRVVSAPEPDEIDTGIDVRLVVEHYSR
ncbi:MAG: 30S ribosomal protein S4 [Chloroflexota bacterium]|nr:30S ribosomal protein S4 [Chloroflexota bacterium]MDE2942416.1 30S ribosomal protein S4 [Chloroflexota bacterium]MDE3267904.1 30S ribosomal protein S4 [Chloroflexota bacterium]